MVFMLYGNLSFPLSFSLGRLKLLPPSLSIILSIGAGDFFQVICKQQACMY